MLFWWVKVVMDWMSFVLSAHSRKETMPGFVTRGGKFGCEVAGAYEIGIHKIKKVCPCEIFED